MVEIIIAIIVSLSVLFFLILRKMPAAKEYIKIREERQDVISKNTQEATEEQEAKDLKNKELYLREAERAFNIQNFPKAESLYIKYASLDPQNPKIYERLSSIYLRWHNWQDAENALRESLKFEPKNDNVHNNLGFALFCQRKYAESVKYYKNAISLDKNIPSRYLNLALSLDKNLKTGEAAAALERALKIDPKYNEARKLLIALREKLKKR